jgi:hypothetical protein
MRNRAHINRPQPQFKQEFSSIPANNMHFFGAVPVVDLSWKVDSKTQLPDFQPWTSTFRGACHSSAVGHVPSKPANSFAFASRFGLPVCAKIRAVPFECVSPRTGEIVAWKKRDVRLTEAPLATRRLL